MADDTRIFSPDQEHPRTVLANDCERRLRLMEEQRARAREMSRTARSMIARALEMRKPPRQTVLP